MRDSLGYEASEEKDLLLKLGWGPDKIAAERISASALNREWIHHLRNEIRKATSRSVLSNPPIALPLDEVLGEVKRALGTSIRPEQGEYCRFTTNGYLIVVAPDGIVTYYRLPRVEVWLTQVDPATIPKRVSDSLEGE